MSASEAGKGVVDTTQGENALDLDELERLAKAATPGVWRENYVDGTGQFCIQEPEPGENILLDVCGGDKQDLANMQFIAAANPKTVLSLIAALRAKETETRAERAEHSLAETQ